jgi:Transcriptional regulators
MPTSKAHDCAERLLSLVPRLMQTLRVEMRAGRPPELTVPQFRTLVFYDNHPGAALSEAADHLGLGMPSASKVVESMVARGFLLRTPNAQDRRRVDITLTPAGQRVLATARGEATAVFTRRLQNLSELELDVLFAVLGSLQSVIGTDSQGCGLPGGCAHTGAPRR